MGDPFERLIGAASNPREVPRPNDPGIPARTLLQALEIARGAGVDIDEDAFAFSVSPQPLSFDGHDDGARYFSLDVERGDYTIELGRLLNKDGKIHITICPTILVSDEDIVHTLAHEMYEATALRARFEESGGRLTASVVRSLVHRVEGTLHCDAWDHADDLLRSLRGTQNG